MIGMSKMKPLVPATRLSHAGDAESPDISGTVSKSVTAQSMTQFSQALRDNPVLSSLDNMWNANPLRDVVPIDWAGIAQRVSTPKIKSHDFIRCIALSLVTGESYRAPPAAGSR